MTFESLELEFNADIRPLKPFGLQILFDMVRRPTLESLPIHALKPLLCKHRLILFRGLEPTAEKRDFAEQCSRWGKLLEWDFGTVFEVVEHADPKNYLFTSGSVPYHWDGAFATQTPWLQIFQCHEAPGEVLGGETIFCDTPAV